MTQATYATHAMHLRQCVAPFGEARACADPPAKVAGDPPWIPRAAATSSSPASTLGAPQGERGPEAPQEDATTRQNIRKEGPSSRSMPCPKTHDHTGSQWICVRNRHPLLHQKGCLCPPLLWNLPVKSQWPCAQVSSVSRQISSDVINHLCFVECFSSCLLPGGRRPSVWLIGDSYIYWAAQRASECPDGLNLGFTHADLSWRGVRDLKWLQVLPEVVAVSNLKKRPAVLVIHAGSYNISSCAALKQLIALMCSDFDHFATLFSDLVIVWSEVIPSVFWFGARDLSLIKTTRRVVNLRVSEHIRSMGGIVIRHKQIEKNYKNLILPDGVRLNNAGLDIFISELRDAIDQALVFLSKSKTLVPPHTQM
ncbi:uncharacterized protein [Dendropsophus ebraccatus]|uniref:uncharacterized protein n=1 Tax=Dendropsophus ebraccatus TaxID=150705 RepID=UPI003831B8E6